jgi:hypothetical protein
MLIDTQKFGGLIPAVNAKNLPDECAQVALNCNLRSGALEPINIVGEFTSLHDANGDMKSEVALGDMAIIAKPDAIALEKSIKMCVPWWKTTLVGSTLTVYGWLAPFANVWVTFIDPTSGEYTATQIGGAGGILLAPKSLDYTPGGFILRCYFPSSVSYTFKPGVAYDIAGPLYKFTMAADTKYQGGPQAAYAFPATLTETDQEIPEFSVPLSYPDSMDNYIDGAPADDEGALSDATGITRYDYGTLQCVDVRGPKKSGPTSLDDAVSVDTSVVLIRAGAEVEFTFRCNYSDRNTPQYVYYLQQNIDAALRDGPVSELSNKIVVNPGEIPKLTLNDGTGSTPPVWSSLGAGIAAGATVAYVWLIGKLSLEATGSVTLYYGGNTETKDYTAVEQSKLAGQWFTKLLVNATFTNAYPNALTSAKVTTASALGANVYRSTTSDESGFRLLGENVVDSFYYDMFIHPLKDALPPNGNIPYDSTDDDEDRIPNAIKGSVVHPGGFSLFLDGKDLRPSSEWIDAARPWAVPEKYAMTFDSDLLCQAIAGGSTTLLFSSAKAYRVVMQDPSRPFLYEMDATMKILDKLSLWKMNDNVGWVTAEGLVVSSGGVPQILTKEYYTQELWDALSPGGFSAYCNDQAVFLLNASEAFGLRFDLRGDQLIALTMFEDFTNKPFRWRSKVWEYPRLITWKAARVIADDYPIVLKVFIDGEEAAEEFVMDNKAFLLPRSVSPGYRMEYEVRGRHAVRRVMLGTSMDEVSSAGG